MYLHNVVLYITYSCRHCPLPLVAYNTWQCISKALKSISEGEGGHSLSCLLPWEGQATFHCFIWSCALIHVVLLENLMSVMFQGCPVHFRCTASLHHPASDFTYYQPCIGQEVSSWGNQTSDGGVHQAAVSLIDCTPSFAWWCKVLLILEQYNECCLETHHAYPWTHQYGSLIPDWLHGKVLVIGPLVRGWLTELVLAGEEGQECRGHIW